MRRVISLVVAAAVLAFFVGVLAGGRGPAAGEAGPTAPGTVLWQGRTLEVLAQAALLLGGVLGILALVGQRKGKGGTP